MARSSRHRPQSGVNWWLVAIPLILVGGGVGTLVLLRGGDTPAPEVSPSPSPQPFAFTRGETIFISLGGGKQPKLSPEDRESLRSAVDSAMNAVYDQGFVTSSAWGDGTFPGFLDHFDGGAAASAEQDLPELTLGPEAAQVRSVEAPGGTLDVFVLVKKREPLGAVASATFTATGALDGGASLAIEHGGRYFLKPVDGTWKIVGYEVEGALDTGGGAPVPGPSVGATP